MASFYVCKLLKKPGIAVAATIVHGNVEIRPVQKQDMDELAMLKSSIESTKLEAELEIEIACRIAVIVQAETPDDADILADQYFVEVLDLLTVEYTMSHLAVAQCGYVKNLDTGEYQVITKHQFAPAMLFIRSPHSMPQINSTQLLAYRSGDLLDRYKRSIHWSRNARWEKSMHLSLLYRWFAVEALFKLNENDDVTSPLMQFLGFPGNAYSKYISRDLLKQLSKDTSYSKWKKQMKVVVDKIRDFRNASVHSGFRSIDCTPDDLRLCGRLMSVGLSRCQGAVQTGILNGLKTVPEFKEYAGLIFENRPNVEGDTIGTIVHILDHDHLKHAQTTYF
ncbi:hypothetical protein [Paraburkholderia sp. BL10I2N1]|uniref:hypothetical protein n=1 Tax=Paraburkholderia sp. BL10I2N1 TaxID=1938796 RepID=UPI0010615487|nr:hypothetical protein [Paraburkholderia sp. BL10I2N1]TDN61138.1 hypothetical protein B0G77_4560 [Paraburkholderia sp. BL10I2N1]